MVDNKDNLVSVLVVAWYFKLVAIVVSFFGLLMLFLDRNFTNPIILKSVPYFGFLGNNIALVFGIFLILLGVFCFLVSRGLNSLKNWAFISSIVLISLQIIVSLISLIFSDDFGSIFNLVIPGFILYFLLKKESIEAFKS